jgi:pimeloyl-ACP methyl ester carboxylesterase
VVREQRHVRGCGSAARLRRDARARGRDVLLPPDELERVCRLARGRTGRQPGARPLLRPALVLLHGFTDTPRTWELVLPRLREDHEVLTPALPGHLGGPALGRPEAGTLADAIERELDAAGLEAAHLVGNSLGGYVALQLAERGRALSVVALAPAGGWAGTDERDETLDFFVTMHRVVRRSAPNADAIAATPEGRRAVTQYITVRHEHLPPDLVAHLLVGAAACDSLPLVEQARRDGYRLDAERIDCPVRIVWGTDDAVLRWPSAAVLYREEWLPNADWVVLDGVGHCPQLDVPLETAELILGFTR